MKQAERMLHEGRMDPEQKELLQMDRLYTFMETGVAKRMMQAVVGMNYTWKSLLS